MTYTFIDISVGMLGMFDVNCTISDARTLREVRSFSSSSGVNDAGLPFTMLLLSL